MSLWMDSCIELEFCSDGLLAFFPYPGYKSCQLDTLQLKLSNSQITLLNVAEFSSFLLHGLLQIVGDIKHLHEFSPSDNLKLMTSKVRSLCCLPPESSFILKHVRSKSHPMILKHFHLVPAQVQTDVPCHFFKSD